MGTSNTNGSNAIKKVGRKISVFDQDTEILNNISTNKYTIDIQDKLPILVSEDGFMVNNNNNV